MIAIIGIVVLVSLYVATFVLALLDHPNFTRLLGGAIVATAVVPVAIWAALLMFKKRDEDDQDPKY